MFGFALGIVSAFALYFGIRWVIGNFKGAIAVRRVRRIRRISNRVSGVVDLDSLTDDQKYALAHPEEHKGYIKWPPILDGLQEYGIVKVKFADGSVYELGRRKTCWKLVDDTTPSKKQPKGTYMIDPETGENVFVPDNPKAA